MSVAAAPPIPTSQVIDPLKLDCSETKKIRQEDKIRTQERPPSRLVAVDDLDYERKSQSSMNYV